MSGFSLHSLRPGRLTFQRFPFILMSFGVFQSSLQYSVAHNILEKPVRSLPCYDRPPILQLLKKSNQGHVLSYYFSQIQFNVALLSTSRFSWWYLLHLFFFFFFFLFFSSFLDDTTGHWGPCLLNGLVSDLSL
jgi:hypothetical protein